jgi:hypothetical protein
VVLEASRVTATAGLRAAVPAKLAVAAVSRRVVDCEALDRVGTRASEDSVKGRRTEMTTLWSLTD